MISSENAGRVAEEAKILVQFAKEVFSVISFSANFLSVRCMDIQHYWRQTEKDFKV